MRLEPLGSLIERLLEQDIGGLFVCGATGEWYAMDPGERMRVAEAAVDAVRGRTRVIVHVGAFATCHATALARHAAHIGAAAVSALPPVGTALPAAAMWDHFRAIADSCGLPLYLYHMPQVYGDQITMDAFLEALDTIPTLAGVKFSSYCVRDLIDLKLKAEGRLNIISGCSEQLLSATVNGAEGSICTWYNCLPRLAGQILECIRRGDLDGAGRYQDQLVRFAVPMTGHHLSALKQLLARRGIDAGYPRRPTPHLQPDAFEILYQRLEADGILAWCI